MFIPANCANPSITTKMKINESPGDFLRSLFDEDDMAKIREACDLRASNPELGRVSLGKIGKKAISVTIANYFGKIAIEFKFPKTVNHKGIPLTLSDTDISGTQVDQFLKAKEPTNDHFRLVTAKDGDSEISISVSRTHTVTAISRAVQFEDLTLNISPTMYLDQHQSKSLLTFLKVHGLERIDQHINSYSDDEQGMIIRLRNQADSPDVFVLTIHVGAFRLTIDFASVDKVIRFRDMLEQTI